MKQDHRSILTRLIGGRSDAVVDALLKSDRVQHLFDEADSKEVARRAKILEQLRSAPARQERAVVAANRAAETARQEVTKASDAVKAATEAYARSLANALSASTAYEREMTLLLHDLETTADPRIEAFASACAQLWAQVRHEPPKTIMEFGATSSRRVGIDVSHVEAARHALTDAITRARSLKTEALSRAQITRSLAEIAASLEGPLNGVGRQPPEIDGGGSSVALQ